MELETSRPQKIYGHQWFFDAFLKSLSQETPHHAWLLTGPQGIGKSLVAQRLARFLLRHSQGPYPETLPSETNDSIFAQTLQGSHPDYLLIQKGEDTVSKSKSFITIEAIRQISHFSQQTSANDGWKVVVVDSVDDMNEKAQNALLKNLEEPSSKTLFFLMSHSTHVLPTIRSRCQEIKLSPLNATDMDQFTTEHPLPLTPQEKTMAQTIACGRVGILQTILEEDGLSLFGEILEGIQEVLTLRSPPYPNCFSLSERALKKGDPHYRLLQYLLTWYTHRITYCLATHSFDNPLDEQEAALFQILSTLSLEKWLTTQEKILELLAQETYLKVEPKQTILGCFAALEQAL